MGDAWWLHLTGKPFYWVLDGTHPAADYFMLRYVVERPDKAKVLKEARLRLAESPQVQALKERLKRGSGTMLWTPRYSTTMWILRLLAEVGVPGDDETIAEALDNVLELDGEGDFEPAPVNVNAIVLYTAFAFGFGHDERVQSRLTTLRTALESHDLPPTPTALADWLTLAAQALAEQPEAERDPAVLTLLRHHLEALLPDVIDRYETYGFPTFDHPDDLVLVQAALQLSLSGEWLRPWVQRIEKSHDAEGLWPLKRALPTPGAISWEERGAPSRWLTAKAIYALRAFYGE